MDVDLQVMYVEMVMENCPIIIPTVQYILAGTFNIPTSYQKWIWEREAHINWSMWPRLVRPTNLMSRMNGKKIHTHTHTWWPAKATLVRNYLEVYWPCAGGLSEVDAIGTQLRDPINSGLTRWRMAVLNNSMDAAAELGRNPVSKHQIQPEYGDEQADAGRDCRTHLTRPNYQARTRTV